jgi:hypothetical protein
MKIARLILKMVDVKIFEDSDGCGNKKSYGLKKFQNKQLCQKCYQEKEKVRDNFGRFKK